jgi:argininosuccinate lyase
MPHTNLSREGRLAAGPADELVQAGHAAEIAQAVRLARGMSISDLAHAVVLAEGGAIDAKTAAALAGGLLELHDIPPDEFPWRPELGDAFHSREAELAQRVGVAAAGWLSAGRPRREVFRVALRLSAREGLRGLHRATCDLAQALLEQAARHANDLAADYTYLQPAQPTTIGHLVLAHVYPAIRDAERLRGVDVWLARSIAGAGGSAGSRWPIDRARLAELLGCDGLMTHTKDAMWQADGYVDLVAAVAAGLSHRAQWAQDLEILATREFGQVELADAHSRTSDLMPQKKNPYALTVIRGAAGAAAGDLAGLLTTLHTGSARTDHFHALNGLVPRLLDDAATTTRLAAAVAKGLTFFPEAAARAAREAHVCAADAADVVAQEGGIDYRSAHKAVGRAVRRLVAEGRPPDALDPVLVSLGAEEVLGRPVEIGADTLRAALDPDACVASRRQLGSCAPDRLAEMLAECRGLVDDARRWEAEAARRAADAERALLDAAARLAARRP